MHDQTPRISEYDLVAEISKAKGLDGQLVALEMGRLSVLYPGLEVWIVPPTRDGVRRSTVIEAIDDFKKRGVLIRLEGVEDRTQATELVGRYLLVQRDGVGVVQRDGVGVVQRDGVGVPLFASAKSGTPTPSLCTTPRTHFADTEYGDLGTLQNIKPGPAYEIWVIEGQYGELNIPAVAEYIVEESPEQITLSLPRGFIEITTKGQGGASHED